MSFSLLVFFSQGSFNTALMAFMTMLDETFKFQTELHDLSNSGLLLLLFA